MEELQTTLQKCVCCRLSPQILFKVTGQKIKDNNHIIDFIEEICCIKDNGWYMHLSETNKGICRQCFTKLENFHSFSKMLKTNIPVDLSEKGSTGKRLLMSPESTSPVQLSSGMTKKRRKLFFSPKKGNFIDDHQYSSKAVQPKGMFFFLLSSQSII